MSYKQLCAIQSLAHLDNLRVLEWKYSMTILTTKRFNFIFEKSKTQTLILNKNKAKRHIISSNYLLSSKTKEQRASEKGCIRVNP